MTFDKNNKLVIDHTDISRIKCMAGEKFKEIANFKGLGLQDIQALLIIEGLYSFLLAQGIDPPFKVKI